MGRGTAARQRDPARKGRLGEVPGGPEGEGPGQAVANARTSEPMLLVVLDEAEEAGRATRMQGTAARNLAA